MRLTAFLRLGLRPTAFFLVRQMLQRPRRCVDRRNATSSMCWMFNPCRLKRGAIAIATSSLRCRNLDDGAFEIVEEREVMPFCWRIPCLAGTLSTLRPKSAIGRLIWRYQPDTPSFPSFQPP